MKFEDFDNWDNWEQADVPSVILMSQVMHMSGHHAKKLFEKYDLKPWQAGILFVLDHCEGEISQRELAKKMNLTPPTITSSIQKMEKEGYIERRADAADQRVMRLNITQKGKDYMDGVISVVVQMEKIIFRGFSSEERMLLKRLLGAMRENLLKEKYDRKEKTEKRGQEV